MLKERWQTTWSRWFGGQQSQVAKASVNRGDRFYRRSKAHHVWIVDRVYTPPGQTVPHARVFRMDEKNDRRLWSEPSLLNRTDFVPDRRRAQMGDPAQYARRCMDKPGGHMRSRLEALGGDQEQG